MFDSPGSEGCGIDRGVVITVIKHETHGRGGLVLMWKRGEGQQHSRHRPVG